MIKSLKKVFAAAAAVFLTAVPLTAVTASADSLESPDSTLTDGTFTYEMVNGSYTVVKCEQTAILVSFPEMRNGYPVTAIADYAFEGCIGVSVLDIPQTVKYIGANAFSGCTSLRTVNLPDGITSIADGTFFGCTSLEEINMSDNVTSIGSYAFAYCTNLGSIDLPSSLSYIGDSAFSECQSLTDINTDSNTGFVFENDMLLNSDKDKVYRASAGLSGNLYIQDGITEIGAGAFSGCFSLESVYIPQGVTKISDYAFRDYISMKKVDIPNGVTSIGTGAFMYCDALETVELPVSLESLGASAFFGCVSLHRAMLQNGLAEIGANAFFACTSLNSVTIPSSVSTIGDGAFGFTVNDAGETIAQSGFSMSVYSGSAGEKYAKSNKIEYEITDKSLKKTAFMIVAVGLILAAAVFAVVLMARSRKGAPVGAKRAKKAEKQKLAEQNYEKIVDDEPEKK